MKFEIQKKKLDDIMYNYIVDLFEKNEHGELSYNYFYDNEGNERDWQINFYFGDYGNEYEAFVWETNEIFEFWDINVPSKAELPRVLMEEKIMNILDAMFNDMWKPIFKRWLKENYGLDPKSII